MPVSQARETQLEAVKIRAELPDANQDCNKEG